MPQRVWTISNGLSVLRIVIVIPLAFLLQSPDSVSRAYAALCIVVAASTDLLDGWIARRLRQVTDLGKIIDPVADKIAVAVVVIVLAMQGAIPVWFLVLVIVRDLAIFFGGMYIRSTRNLILQSNLTGKWAVSTVAAYILATVVLSPGSAFVRSALLVLSTCMLIISFARYARRYLTVLNNEAVISSPT